MKIYRINNTDTYLLVYAQRDWYSGRDKYHVWNGSYQVDLAPDKSHVWFIQPGTKKKIIADYVRDVPKYITNNKKLSYNEILNRCLKGKN